MTSVIMINCELLVAFDVILANCTGEVTWEAISCRTEA